MSPVQSRRQLLQDVQYTTCSHAGLWLDKYMDHNIDEQDEKAEKKLVSEVARIGENDIYRNFYKSWKQTLKNAGAIYDEATVQGRLAINLGDESVLETSIALHHTYGTPYIPGSALKGLAAFYARNYLDENSWKEDSDYYQVIFGSKDAAGYITFHDALHIPGSGKLGKALHTDIITVHHPDYYQGADEPPADWDNPTPINFLSATGKYLLALSGPEQWTVTAFKILDQALATLGVGAKTSSGYGRMMLDKNYLPPKELVWRDGRVRYFNPGNGQGMIIDEETQEKIIFTRQALPRGWDPGGRQKISYALYGTEGEVQQVKRRY